MIKIVAQGLGPIGKETAKLISKNKDFEIVGAVDPKYRNVNLGDLLENNLDIQIAENAEDAFKETKPDVVVLATCSRLDEIIPSLETAVKYGVNVVSPSEELFYPQSISPEKAKYIDELAEKSKVRILGGGVNPGCLMDTFPLYIFRKNNFVALSKMSVFRCENISERRDSLKKKLGVGLDEEKFYALNRKNKIGHVGLVISASYLADNLGLKNYRINFLRKPIINDSSGEVTGLHEICSVFDRGENKINLYLKMSLHSENRNSTNIKYVGKGFSTTTLSFDYSDIVNGDISTSRILEDAVRNVIKGPYGLNRINYVPDPYTLLKK